MRTFLLLCPLALLLVLLSACGNRHESTSGDAGIAHLADQDLSKLKGVELERAQASIGRERGAALAPSLLPLRVWALGEHHLVLLREDNRLQVELLQGGIRWQRILELGQGFSLEATALGSHREVNHPVLVIDAKPPRGHSGAAATRLYLAVTGSGGFLVRAVDGQRQMANQLLHRDHPDLSTDAGDLAGSDSAAQLAALVHLAQPAQRQQLGGARITGLLEGLASGTNLWSAEGAALVLTLR
ncbi:MAG: hypothetical protein EA402_10560 [Planctomycetota bacterium]|nr:MAG: hypothetical protein EA402_10560 [Planctomycetota bacterium]